jgi:hypothetical protein
LSTCIDKSKRYNNNRFFIGKLAKKRAEERRTSDIYEQITKAQEEQMKDRAEWRKKVFRN